ncbi:MAG: PA0069 family radical SAM protein [Rhodobacterales bacterium]|nr:PA0069 family radical SAM protein [Rhodobacterales bacterium]
MIDEAIPFPQDRRRGRAAVTNPINRFDRLTFQPVYDGWAQDKGLPPLRTEVSDGVPRPVITRNTSPDIGFDRSINPYRGCEHDCIDCFARPSHVDLGLSLGLDFETRLVARPDAPRILKMELRAKSYVPKVIPIGTNAGAYQPAEKDRRIMRGVLEVLSAFDHPVGIVTKGTLVERDIDILAPMAAKGLVRVGISVTTLHPAVSRAMEPRVPSPARRLETIHRLSGAGIPVRVMVSPIVPALTDHEMDAILGAGKAAGAVAASFIVLRLARELSGLFREWLEEAFPDRAKRIMGCVRELNGGRDYDPKFSKRRTRQGEWARLFRARFDLALTRLGVAREMPALRCDLFRVPVRAGDQLELF